MPTSDRITIIEFVISEANLLVDILLQQQMLNRQITRSNISKLAHKYYAIINCLSCLYSPRMPQPPIQAHSIF